MTEGFKKICLKSILYLVLTTFSFASIYPLIWMAFNSLKNNEEIFSTNVYGFPTNFRIENYVNAITQFNILLFFKNSTFVAIITVTFTILIALMFSYATARMRWRLSNAVRIYAILGMFIPVQIIIIPLVILVRDLHLQDTLLSVIIPYIVFNLSFTSMVFYAFFRSIPYEMEESAAIDGANIYTCFFLIIMPLVKPAIASASIFIFLNSWNELFTALIVISNNALKTLPLGLVYFQGKFATDWGASAAALTIASIAPIILYLIFSKQVENALTIGAAVKG
ncbi:carbohydrate ABC transporter permease [Kineothrix sp. MB12-C1]|uniref:carbohydrate ABC transporter permease n=1 Tax=Kineothrix sp. MB12-C1 TaxID=3070215 RepID=UPI0027D1EE9E|nr:carbohydrate ABC transporter permease [Kineothrix sp. MB12-C1]WMC94191.1 carbohydrate ABC transporter permease [Kineothrix sp. MB12-C1]